MAKLLFNFIQEFDNSMKKCFLISLFTFVLGLVCPGETVIELVQGGEIKAEIIQEKPDRVVVDLGFSVISIPRDSIARMYSGEERYSEDEFGEDFYRTDKNAQMESVKEQVEAIGESVVMVRTPTGLGSGFLIHPSGYVVTNDHVIAGEHEISITLYEKTANELLKVSFENVRIVASSPELDLALLKIEDIEDRLFPTVPLGYSDLLRSGQTVFAIGNPLGLERSVSQGIVSLKDRLIAGRLFIQTTTQINPGNSGGPLFNRRGEVVGVTNMKVNAFGAEGLAFAIPSTVLKSFLKNRDAYAFDSRNPNSGYRYNKPPNITPQNIPDR